MFDPRDLATDPRKPAVRPRRDHCEGAGGAAAQRPPAGIRSAHKASELPGADRPGGGRDIGMYRSVATRDLAEAHFEGTPLCGTPGRGTHGSLRTRPGAHRAWPARRRLYKVLTLTERGVERAERVAREQGLDPEQKAWSGLVKPE